MSLRFYVFTVVLFFFYSTEAQVVLPRMVRDSMILQRDTKINIWGWATRDEKVSVKFNGKNYKTITGNNGKWKIQLAPAKAGGPYTMEIAGKNKIVLNNILIGDVWVCSGQSNMEHQLRLHDIIYAEEIQKANYPEIRQFKVPNVTSLTGKQNDLPAGSWKWANPTDVRDFSAVAYFFAKTLYEKYHVPIGLINASWGGSPIEAWMGEDSFTNFPDILKTIEKNKDTATVNAINRKAFADYAALPKPEDKGLEQKWFDISYQPKGWRKIAVPGYWEDQGIKNLDGIVWYRKEIDIPAAILNTPAKIFLGRIVDADILYINGVQVGTTGYLYPQRRYIIPAGVLKAGKNLLVVRVTNNAGKGGFVPDKPYQLISGKDTIDLTGYWTYKVGAVNKMTGFSSGAIALQNQPTALYNAMLAPITNYSIKGSIWYQGESNTGKPDEYAALQPAMINGWRNAWQQGNLPFLFAQLPGFMDYNYQPTESGWAAFREAQAKSLAVANTGMAVTIDLGEWNDIHPDNKKDVGVRLALAAEKVAYGENIVHSGPLYTSSKIEGDKIVVSFSNTGNGLTTSDGEVLQEFAIAGSDKKFVWAKTKIEGDKIIIWNDDIQTPMYVRYAWSDNPVNPNLINKEGLPASPFRTDK